MKQIRVHGPNDVRLDDVEPASPGPRDAVVRVAACGICGSDVSYIHMGGLTKGPMCLGHECAGIVVWVGAEVAGASVGDRVIVHTDGGDTGSLGSGAREGALTHELLVRDAARGRLYRVPDGMPLRTAALAEPLGVGMQAVNQAAVSAGEKVAVFGCGPIGLMAIATLLDRGIHEVVAIDLSPTRLALAQQLGVQAVLNPTTDDVWAELARLHGSVPFRFGPTPGTDVFIEASGASRVIGEVIQNGRFGGRLSVVALHFEPVPTSYLTVLMKQFHIVGSIEYPTRFEDTIELLGRRDLSPLITHEFPLEQFHDGLALLEGSKDCGKVMITMGVE